MTDSADTYFDLGPYSRPITTASPAAQCWFDRGLLWCYGFNFEEAVRCFEQAATLDPACAMAYWGIAYAAGPNYNLTWEDLGWPGAQAVAARCYTATQAALARLEGATPVEQALIRALPHRYQADHFADEAQFGHWNDAYAAAMRQVYRAYPEDLDVSSLFVEALLCRTPWQLWDITTGEPAAGADTLEALAVLEQALQLGEERGEPPHAGLLHLHIHTLEMSPHPERALRSADSLRDLIPDAGHLLHMPSHIDILCGHYYNAVVANSRATVVDDRYLAQAGPLNVYTMYRCHNFHFKIYAAMFLGQLKTALATADQLIAALPAAVLRVEEPPLADILECLISMRQHVLIRFGQWQTILDEPLPVDQALYCHTTAILHYAKGIAHAALGNIAEAEMEQARFRAAQARVPKSRNHFNNTCADVLAVAAEMLAGEIEYRKANYDRAFAHLRRSVALDDNLAYAEPWGWMQPTRHALGALLLEQGHIEEALAIYRADLGLDNTLTRPSQHPENVWSLHGYVECLRRLERHADVAAIQPRLDLALARADVPIHASCFCRQAEGCCAE
ncbi:MAG: tetratricopeptide repeat protein [Caldilineaceae bacterium]